MSRLTPWILATMAVAVAIVGIGTVAAAGRLDEERLDGPLQEFDVDLFMSASADGPQQRSFMSDTTRVFAVVAFENAANQQYRVRLRDLAGIQVFDEALTLNGSGRLAKMITADNFVDSYNGHVDEETAALAEAGAELTMLCQSPPSPPVPTQPPVNPTPGPTPTPGGWDRWQARMLDAIEASNTSGAALGQTLQAVESLPDVSMLPAVQDDIAIAQQAIADMKTALEQADRKVNPPAGTGPGTPTPDPPPVPDPQGACQLVSDAAVQRATAITRSKAAVEKLPDDASSWRFPQTSASYDNGQFSSCINYSTELVQGTYIAATTPWTVGDAGLPALIFPAAELMDKSSVGQLRLRLPEGATAMYAQSVDVPGVNRKAEIQGFVTDAMCNPVDGVTMTLSVGDPLAGSVDPRVVDVVAGVATTTLTSGVTPTLNSAVTGLVCVGPCGGGATDPGPAPITGRVRFSVVGPPYKLTFHVNPEVINALKEERANISVEAKDYYNRKVADGTVIHVAIAAGDPGQLARSVTPRGSRQSELQLLGKELDVTTFNGFTVVPAGDDPGLSYGPDLYLVAGDDGYGPVELTASWGTVASKPAIVTIVSRRLIFLPLVMKKYDVLATPPYSTTPVAPAGGPARATPEP